MSVIIKTDNSMSTKNIHLCCRLDYILKLSFNGIRIISPQSEMIMCHIRDVYRNNGINCIQLNGVSVYEDIEKLVFDITISTDSIVEQKLHIYFANTGGKRWNTMTAWDIR